MDDKSQEVEHVKNIAWEAAHLTDKDINDKGLTGKRADQYSELVGDLAVNAAEKIVKAEKDSMIDPLTGLWNRRYFDLVLANEIDKANRRNGSISIIMFDLDELKEINDKYGHPAGDQSLIALVQIVQGSHHAATSELKLGRKDQGQILRESDIFCRLSGDEFAVFLPEADSEQAQKIAERIRTNIDRQSRMRSSPGFTVSLGVTELVPGEEIIKFLKRADKALYQSKNNGRNQVTVIKQ